jgi:hypothetical protein
MTEESDRSTSVMLTTCGQHYEKVNEVDWVQSTTVLDDMNIEENGCSYRWLKETLQCTPIAQLLLRHEQAIKPNERKFSVTLLPPQSRLLAADGPEEVEMYYIEIT